MAGADVGSGDYPKNGPLAGTVAVISGATSGIGRATAICLAARGARVVVGGRNAEAAEQAVTAVAEAGGQAMAVLGEITDPAYSTAVIDAAVSTFGGLDIIVNAAGTITRSTAEHTSDDDYRRVMAVNVDGTFFLSRAAIPALRERGSGSIVNIASNVGLVGAAGLAAYCASKGAVVLLTQSMALEHAAEGIRVNAVCPGAVDTPMLRLEREAAIAAGEMTEADILAANEQLIPQGRVADAHEIAELVAFLASTASAHITGTAIPIDGGYLAQ